MIDAGNVPTAQGQEPFLAMELVAGPPLLEGVEQLALDLRDRVRVLIALCRAVAHAHRRGIIHRDLKPQNVRLDLDAHPPTPRVLDFGVATPRPAVGAATGSDIVGTLGYLAPEQLRGAIDVRCDVYSLGAIAYHLLTGQRAFDLRGLDVATASERLRTEDPLPASRHRPQLRGDLDAVLAKALARDPGQRYASADALADDWQRWLDHRPVEARPAHPLYAARLFVRRQPVVAALTALCTASLLLGLLVALLGAAEARRANQHLLGVLGLALAELGPKVHGGTAMQSMPEGLVERIDDLVAAQPYDPRVLGMKATFLRLDSEIALRAGKLRRAQFLRQDLVALRERITTAEPSPANRHEQAIAWVLLGDTEKELVEPVKGDTEAARQLYLRAHDVFAQFVAERPQGRNECDDLAHSHLRLAYLDLRHDRLAAAEQRIEAARLLVEQLQQDHADHPYTQTALREFLGLCGLLATKRGDGQGALSVLDRSLQHILRAHQMAPNDLHIAEFALATATASGRSARLHGDLAKARSSLQLATTLGRQLTARCPDHCNATDLRCNVAREVAQIALEDGNLADCFLHLADAAELALSLRMADSPVRMNDNMGEVVSLAQHALLRWERSTGELRETSGAVARLLLAPLMAAVALRPSQLEWRILLTQLQASCGSGDDAQAARSALDEAVHAGWFDARLWLVVTLLLEREAQIPAALANLDAAPEGISDDLRTTAAYVRDRLRRR